MDGIISSLWHRYRKCPKCRTRAFAPLQTDQVWKPTAAYTGSDIVEKACLACGYSCRHYVDTHRQGTIMTGDSDRRRASKS